MEYPGLKEYLNYYLKIKKPEEIKQELINRGFPAEVIDSAIKEYYNTNSSSNLTNTISNTTRYLQKEKWIKIATIILLILTLISILSIGYLYYFVINPVVIQKPIIEKPNMDGQSG